MKKFIVLYLLFVIGSSTYAARFTAVLDGDWNDGATWGNTSPGLEGTDWPGIADTARPNGHQIGISIDVSCNILFLLAGTPDQIVWSDFDLFEPHTITIGSRLMSSSSSGPTVSVLENSSDLTLVFTRVGEIISRWSENAPIYGMVVNSGGRSTLGSDIAIGGGLLTINSGSTLEVGTSRTISNSSSSTISVAGTLDVLGAVNGGATSSNFSAISSTGVVSIGADGYINSSTLSLSSGTVFNISNNQTNGWWHDASTGPATTTIDANSTVNYTRELAQGIAARTYGNLSITSGGIAVTKTLSSTGTLTVQGNLVVGSSTTFSTSSNTNNFVFQGGITNNGVFTVARPTTFNGGGTQVIGGASGITFTNTVLISNAINFDTDVTFGGTVTSGSNNLSFAKNLTSNTNFNCAGTVTIDGAIAQSITGTGTNTFANLTISNTASTTTINGTGSLVEGTLTLNANTSFNANGNLTLVSDAGGTARLAEVPSTASFSGNVIYQRYITGAQQWHNIGLPISGTTTDITNSGYPAPGNDLGRYDETAVGDIDQGWETAPTFTAINNNRGYSLWTRTANDFGTLGFTGALTTAGNKSLLVSRTSTGVAADDGWSLVNNPYASPIDWTNPGWAKNNIDATIYVWNPSTSSYISGPTVIASGQSFWVHSSSGTPTLTATQAVKTSSGATFYRVAESEIVDELLVTLVDGEKSDLARVLFRDDATEEFDTQYDGYKLKNDIFNLSSITVDGLDLSINNIPMIDCNRTVKFNITNITEGGYQLKFDGLVSFDTGYEFTLKDNFLSTSTIIEEGALHEFSVTVDAASWGNTRFEIEIAPVALATEVLYELTDQCNFESSLTITNAQVGVDYTLVQDGENIVSKKASSSTLVFPLTDGQVVEGLNKFDLYLSNGNCGTPALLTDAIEFTVNSLQLISSVTDGLNCGAGSVLIKVEGATGNAYYNWYESLDAIAPIPNQNSGEYLTPEIEATKFYFVSIINESGCESLTRTKVIAEVVNVAQPNILIEGDVISTTAVADSYQWYNEGKILDGEVTESIIVNRSGVYSVEITTNTCIANSENIVVDILGVKDLEEIGIGIYPNPVIDLLHINSNKLKINSILIYDTKGIEILRLEDSIPTEINVNNLKKGIYIINIATDNQTITYRVKKK